jgi:uncharacterized protein (TIGR02099 family)
VLRRIGRLIFKLIPLWSWRIAIYGLLSALVLCGGLILTLRYAVLPNIATYRGDLEQLMAQTIGQRVKIGEIRADWRGLRPQFIVTDVVIYDAADRPALELGRIDSTLAWSSLFFLEPRFHAFEVHEPHLDIRRSPAGEISIAGIPLAKADGRGGLTDWVLRQPALAVSQASVSWIDEQRQAPELRLEQVSMRLQNQFFRHRFGMRASGPEGIVGKLDLRADFSGDSVRELRDWEGQLFVAIDYADLAAYKQWLDLPLDVARGRGALRMWVDVDEARVTAVVADVRLAGVSARLGAERDELHLETLSGRVGWQGWRSGFALSARALTARAEGHAFRPLDFELRKQDAQGGKPARGELKANALDLAAITHLVGHLPLDAELVDTLRRYSPRGNVLNVSASWSGDWPPAQYEAKARFQGLGLEAVGAMPGLQNVSGSIDASEKRGVLMVENRDMVLQLPQVFAEPLRFEALSGGFAWTLLAGRYELRIGNLAFANADLEGSVQGVLQLSEQGPGMAELAGGLKRVDARQVARYLPLAVAAGTRNWLQQAVLAGSGSDVKWRLKGDVARFPFAQGGGTFELGAKLRAGVLEYAPGWPRIDDIAADLAIAGSRFELRAATGTVFGVRLARVLAVIPDLSTDREMLEIAGEAHGASSDFLRFVSASPIGADVDRFLQGVEAQGRGRLGLKFTLPLAAPADVRVAGNYQFIGNRIRMDSALPVLENVDGRIDFTESSVRAQNIGLQVFGGPASLNVSTQGNAVLLKAGGRASMAAVRKLFDVPLLQAVQGSTDWRSSLELRGKIGEFVLESGLQGIASVLPAPLGKTAPEVLPLRVERRLGSEAADTLHVTLGPQVAVVVHRRRDGGGLVAERVGIGLGVEPTVADAPGSTLLRGSLPRLDLDRWRATLAEYPSLTNALPPFAGVDLKLGALELFGRRFHEVSLNARRAEQWRIEVGARELNGDVTWRTADKGQVVVRLQRLALPAAFERLEEPVTAADRPSSNDYPALDVVVEDFSYKDLALGRLELSAVPDGRDWRIERLSLRNPDAVLSADGLWQWQARASRTHLKLKLETGDIGKLLTRMNYPQGVRGGTAILSGALSWVGPPQDIDYPTLSGQLAVQAGRGQFAKLDPGIGKLLSILSLQALPRRVTLDFKDVFSDGFAFDTIQATAKIERGIAATDDFRIQGSSAKVLMSGEIDLARETQNLKVRVTPSVGDSVATVSALLGGPVVGLGVFLAQRLLNDPLGQLVAYDFSVTGSWSDPAVSKITFDRSGPG